MAGTRALSGTACADRRQALASIAGCALALLYAVAAPALAGPLTVLGHVENVWFDDRRVVFPARMDSGAKTSSMDASDPELFERDGQSWVRFDLIGAAGQMLSVERPVLRVVRIRRAGIEPEERVVIALTICLGGESGEAEFSLARRQGMKYPVLIGRQFLGGRFLVDPGRSFLASDLCEPRADR